VGAAADCTACPVVKTSNCGFDDWIWEVGIGEVVDPTSEMIGRHDWGQKVGREGLD